MRKGICIVTLIIINTLAFSADIDGTWNGSVPDSLTGGLSPIIYKFKMEKTVLTGTVTAGGLELEIRNGRISGNNIYFTVDAEYYNKHMEINYTGIVSFNSIKLRATINNIPMDILIVKENNRKTNQQTTKKSINHTPCPTNESCK